MNRLVSLPESSKLHPVLRSALKKATGRESDPSPSHSSDTGLWHPDFFSLARTRVFQNASAREQAQVLRLCCRSVLEEALFIEQAGMNYTARMVQLARTEQEKLLYSLFNADEATHYYWIREALSEDFAQSQPNLFHQILAESIESQSPESLIFLIQVFLEGWGLQRYGELMRATTAPALRETFQTILHDEARHHGSGVVLCREGNLLEKMSVQEKSALFSTLRRFLDLVRVGPLSVLTALDEGLGGLTSAQKVSALEELDSESHSQLRLNFLRNLLHQEKAFDLLSLLDETDAFTPLAPKDLF